MCAYVCNICMCVFVVCVFKYICVFVYVCVCMYLCVCVFVCMYVCTYVYCVCVRVFDKEHVWGHSPINASMLFKMSICVCAVSSSTYRRDICIHTYTHTYTYVHAYVHGHMHLDAYGDRLAHSSQQYPQVGFHQNILIHACIHTLIHKLIYTNT